MPIIDLTHPITTDMPTYPGTEGPELIPACTLEIDGFAEKMIRLYSHTGTHMDAPSHLFAGGRDLDSYPVKTFTGPGCCLDLRDLADPEIGLAAIAPLADTLAAADFLLLNTGWSKRWGHKAYFEQHPVLSSEAARWLSDFNLKAVGLDNISADRFDTETFPIHTTLLQREILIIENLAHLDRLPVSGFRLTGLPLKLAQADGAPVRVIAEF
jgi:kynurenine formamidase